MAAGRRPSSSMFLGCGVPLRGHWANFSHTGWEQVGRVLSTKEKSIEILQHRWEFNQGHGGSSDRDSFTHPLSYLRGCISISKQSEMIIKPFILVGAMGNTESNSTVCVDYVTHYNSSHEYRGSVVEHICNDTLRCDSWMLLPAENLWSEGVRGFLYIIGMLYVFIGVAIASDIFMMSIEVITSKKRTVVLWDEEKQEKVEREVLVWNETVSNLTLMALGSSAPEILIAIVELFGNLPFTVAEGLLVQSKDGLGVFTIMGSASYNLLIISAICIVAPNLPEHKKVSQFSVFLLTSIWSLWAYIWMLLVVKIISPGVVEIWEAWITLLFFPLMTLTAYCQDNGWWISKCLRKTQVSGVDEEQQNQTVSREIFLSIPHHRVILTLYPTFYPIMGFLHGKPAESLQLLIDVDCWTLGDWTVGIG